mgnify:CR=1 FL=1
MPLVQLLSSVLSRVTLANALVVAASYAKSINAIHVHTSAKQGKGLDEIFTALSRAIVKKNSSGSGYVN